MEQDKPRLSSSGARLRLRLLNILDAGGISPASAHI